MKRSVLYTIALLSLLVIFPLISIFWLNKGYKDTLGIQQQLEAKYRFAADSFLLDHKGARLSFHAFDTALSLLAFNPDKGQLDSLRILGESFRDEPIFGVGFVVDSAYARKIDLTSGDIIYTWSPIGGNEVEMPNGAILLDTSSLVILESPLRGLKDYQTMAKAIVLRLPKKKKKFLVFEREKEK